MSLTDFERCCRLCAQEQDVTIMLFSQEAQALHLENKLNKYLLMEIDEDDRLPKNICIQCCTKLQTVCDFIDTAKKAQEELIKRCSMLDQVKPINKTEPETQEESDDEGNMEVSVDPMMVLQNEEGPLSDDNNSIPMEDVTYMHGVDAENVTIKLIRKGDMKKIEENKDNKPFSCSSCDRRFCSELALKNHGWIHNSETKMEKQYKCFTCLEAFHYRYDLVSHLKKHQSSGVCQLCGRVFRSERTYLAHMSVHLPTNKSYTCKICGRSYNSWGGLKTHMITHSNERPYQCHYCKKNFKRNQDLKFHINQHTGAKPYKCPFCDKAFASSGNCYSHRSRMHPVKAVASTRARRLAPNLNLTKDSPQLRPIAPKPLTKPDDNMISINGIFKYQCTICDHSFMKKDNFTYHMVQHTGEKPFECSFCAANFMTRRGLHIHHDRQHPTKDRPLALLSKNVLLK